MLAGLFSLSLAGTLAEPKRTAKVFLDIEIDGKKAGRIVIGLYGNVVPRTVDNFLHLCMCDKGKGKSGKDLCYKGTPFHRIIPGFVIQSGDITNGDGTGGESIWGVPFPDESFIVRQDRAGIVAMANDGRNSNKSQFYITTAKSDAIERLQSAHVAFGYVISGMRVVKRIQAKGGIMGHRLGKLSLSIVGNSKSQTQFSFFSLFMDSEHNCPDAGWARVQSC
jgi:cyclophilin family peptidyl-prolyl cis-trans isomerase